MTTTLTALQRAALTELAVPDRDPEESSSAAYRAATNSTGGKRSRAGTGRRRVVDNLIEKGLAEREGRVRRLGKPEPGPGFNHHYQIVVITDVGRRALEQDWEEE